MTKNSCSQFDVPTRSVETATIHSGSSYREQTGAVVPPIYATSTFARGNEGRFDYTRSGNPNFRNLEETLAEVERASHAVVFSSGVAAMTAVVSSLKSGDLILAEENIYGCTFRLFSAVFQKFGLRVQYADFSSQEALEQIERHKPQVVWLESPTNPLLKIIDIQSVAGVAKKAGSLLLVDNTFATGYCQQPLDLGADLSLSSTTKYINGHSDCLGGVVCTNRKDWAEKLVFAQKALGLNPAPFDCWLISRGVRTLHLRMERHARNAAQLAEFLSSLPRTRWVRYPWHKSHPQYHLARKQMKGGSGIVTADLGLDGTQIQWLLGNLRLFTFAESLGGVESLACHPASMTHASVPREVREAVGLGDGVVRFSCGIEHGDDLVNDLRTALEGIREPALANA